MSDLGKCDICGENEAVRTVRFTNGKPPISYCLDRPCILELEDMVAA